MSEIKNLEPRAVWRYFDEIIRVPRPSKHEGFFLAYLVAFAQGHKFEYRRDAAGNIVILKPASPGMEGAPGVILQAHVDMVCEKVSDVEFDFRTDPIRAYIEDGWVKARGTTLGADDGIGMAAALAVLSDPSLVHGPLEALFTVDEETGLTGAFNLGEGMLTGKYLINLDSEDEGEIFIGCAGGITTVATFAYEKEPSDAGTKSFAVALKGLTGGHSGDDIDKGYGNSNKILTRFLLQAADRFGLRLSRFEGGNLHNAIPREASAVFTVPASEEAGMKRFFEEFVAEIKDEYKYTETKIAFALEPSEAEFVIDWQTQRNLLLSLQGVVNGVLAMSRAMPGLVETSSNLASVKFADGQRIVVTTSQRSSVESAKTDVVRTVESPFLLAGAKVEHSEGYPGWTPDPDSYLLQTAKNAYRKLFGREARVRAIHAGLECGLFLKKHPCLEMISIGPTLRGVHSPDERLEIATVSMFWKLLAGILAGLKK